MWQNQISQTDSCPLITFSFCENPPKFNCHAHNCPSVRHPVITTGRTKAFHIILSCRSTTKLNVTLPSKLNVVHVERLSSFCFFPPAKNPHPRPPPREEVCIHLCYSWQANRTAIHLPILKRYATTGRILLKRTRIFPLIYSPFNHAT